MVNVNIILDSSCYMNDLSKTIKDQMNNLHKTLTKSYKKDLKAYKIPEGLKNTLSTLDRSHFASSETVIKQAVL